MAISQTRVYNDCWMGVTVVSFLPAELYISEQLPGIRKDHLVQRPATGDSFSRSLLLEVRRQLCHGADTYSGPIDVSEMDPKT